MCSPEIIKVFFNIMNICVGAFIGYCGVDRFICFCGEVNAEIIAFFLIIFALIIIIVELVYVPFISMYFQFYMRWLGRGMFFIFLGCSVLIRHQDLKFAGGLFVICWGFLSCLFECLRVVAFPGPLCGPAAGGRQQSAV